MTCYALQYIELQCISIKWRAFHHIIPFLCWFALALCDDSIRCVTHTHTIMSLVNVVWSRPGGSFVLRPLGTCCVFGVVSCLCWWTYGCSDFLMTVPGLCSDHVLWCVSLDYHCLLASSSSKASSTELCVLFRYECYQFLVLVYYVALVCDMLFFLVIWAAQHVERVMRNTPAMTYTMGIHDPQGWPLWGW